ncbi:DsbA family protein [Acidimangrovimonas sediminis]|uniref:DsbA family protein n=1 Tax=Acidimangrovimonas sediminis TaxID=2056283 RepID=UPI000C8103F6|nr:DsbA family protein [Acidimangrovimonas sediminis]
MLKTLPGVLRATALIAAAALWTGVAAPAANAQTSSDTGQTKAATQAPETKAQSDARAKEAADLPKVPDYSEGDANAPIHVIEYGAFTCPHCAEFHKEVYPQLKKNYIDTGKVKFTFRAFFFDKYGLWADAIARCGGEMRFYGISDMIYDQQRDWAASNDPNEVIAKLTKIGLSAGLSKDQIQTCLSDGKMLQAMVLKFQTLSQKDQIDGTPTFIINGKKYNNMSYEDFSKTLDGLLKK